MLDRFTSERLAVVEAESAVDERLDIARRTPASMFERLHVQGHGCVTGNQIASWQATRAIRRR
jgi:hypothetical protein